MNTLLKKCLDELASEKPRLDYVSGILETIIGLGTKTATPIPAQQVLVAQQGLTNAEPVEESFLLDSIAKANIEKLKRESQMMQDA